MAISEYSIGGNNQSVNTYWERLRRDRYSTPRFLRDQGIFLDLPYARESESMLNSRMTIKQVYGSGQMDVFMAVVGPQLQMSYNPVYPSEGDVIAKLASKWRNTDLNLAMYLSPEGRESASMLLSTIGKLSNSVHSLKRGDFGGFVRNLHTMPRNARRRSHRKFTQGDLSGAFLSAHLGWEPLIKDAYESANIKPPIAKGERIVASKAGTPRSFYVLNAGSVHVGEFVQEGKLRVSLSGDVSKPVEWFDRFGLRNPFGIAWELVPLSFVADYFLPIGQTIDNMGFISAARFARMWRKVYEDRSATLKTRSGYEFNFGGEPWQTISSGSTYRHWRSYSRTPYELNFASPLRTLGVSMPSSILKLSTMSALLHQRILSLR